MASNRRLYVENDHRQCSIVGLCAAAQGFSLHAALRCGAHQRKELERLCRTITRPAIANERVKRDGAMQLKSAWRVGGDGLGAPALARVRYRLPTLPAVRRRV